MTSISFCPMLLLCQCWYQLLIPLTLSYFRFLADDNLLWKEQCRRIGITTLKKMPRSLPRCASPWKAAYMRQYLIENNWLNKPVNNPIIMRGHDDHVITCLQFYGNRILSGSDDTTLKVWSAVTGKVRTIVKFITVDGSLTFFCTKTIMRREHGLN